MVKDGLRAYLVELIRLAATDLPQDVEEGLRLAWKREDPDSAAARALETILKNVGLAREHSIPLCQDTGVPSFYVALPFTFSQEQRRETSLWENAGYHLPDGVAWQPPLLTHLMEEEIKEAVRQATRQSYLRPNAVDTLTEENTGDNVGGDTFPVIEFSYHNRPFIIVDLLLKGGGSENVGAQYALPDLALGANRSLGGVLKCVLHAVFKAQGLGCPPGIIGVAIGGDRAGGYKAAKKALLKKIDEPSADEVIARWEEKIREEANRLGIGPMGFGGKTTLLGVHLAFLHRHPASFFVSISYSCWALRRKRLIWDGEKGVFQ